MSHSDICQNVEKCIALPSLPLRNENMFIRIDRGHYRVSSIRVKCSDEFIELHWRRVLQSRRRDNQIVVSTRQSSVLVPWAPLAAPQQARARARASVAPLDRR